MRRGEPWLWLVAWPACVAGLTTGTLSCSSPEELAGQGGQCTLVTDCQAGLVCGPGPNGTRVCTSSTAGLEPPQDSGSADVASMPPPSPSDATSGGDGAKTDAMASTGDAAAPPSDATSPAPDVEIPDVETPPMDSSKLSPDSSRPDDAASPPNDARADDTGAATDANSD